MSGKPAPGAIRFAAHLYYVSQHSKAFFRPPHFRSLDGVPSARGDAHGRKGTFQLLGDVVFAPLRRLPVRGSAPASVRRSPRRSPRSGAKLPFIIIAEPVAGLQHLQRFTYPCSYPGSITRSRLSTALWRSRPFPSTLAHHDRPGRWCGPRQTPFSTTSLYPIVGRHPLRGHICTRMDKPATMFLFSLASPAVQPLQ